MCSPASRELRALITHKHTRNFGHRGSWQWTRGCPANPLPSFTCSFFPCIPSLRKHAPAGCNILASELPFERVTEELRDFSQPLQRVSPQPQSPAWLLQLCVHLHTAVHCLGDTQSHMLSVTPSYCTQQLPFLKPLKSS